MNKGFFVVFLGIIIGAMALIFFSQTNSPVTTGVVAQKTTAVAEAPAPKEEALPQAPAQPVKSPEIKNEPVAPTPPKAEPDAVKPPEPAQPAVPQPEPEKSAPVAAAPEEPAAPRPESAVKPAPEPVKPAPAGTPEPVKPAPAAAPEPVKPEPVKTEQAAEPAKPQGKNPVLKNIGLHFKDNGMALRIEADRRFSYKTFVLPSPDRYVIDLVGAWENLRVPKVPANRFVKSMRVGQQSGGPRMVMDLQRAPKKHNVVWLSPTILEIQIE